MKKLLIYLLTLAMVLSLTACGGKKKTGTTANYVQSTSKGAETADETSADKKLFAYEFGGRAYEDILLKYFEAVENDAP